MSTIKSAFDEWYENPEYRRLTFKEFMKAKHTKLVKKAQTLLWISGFCIGVGTVLLGRGFGLI